MGNIKKMVLLLAAILTFCMAAMAQTDGNRRQSREQLAERQAAHIVKTMAMDEATAKKFTETYLKCQREVWALGPRPGAKGRTATTKSQGTQDEQDIEARFEHSRKLLDIREKYYKEYSGFLSQRQIQRVYALEKQMMERLSRHRTATAGQQRKGARR